MKNDGYTGRNFNRPGFQAMLAEAEAGKIGTIIVKDMSRFCRNYLEVGFYTEILFPKKQIRFIAIYNSVVFDDRTMIIVSLAFCIGVGLTQTSGNFFSAFPKEVGDIFNGNAVAGVFVVSLILSLCLPKKKTTDL